MKNRPRVYNSAEKKSVGGLLDTKNDETRWIADESHEASDTTMQSETDETSGEFRGLPWLEPARGGLKNWSEFATRVSCYF